ncbi:VapE domain-containing protein [Arenibacter troitsensis]|uniref:Virulence-associated protein E n=1 Tax=Arenibacter troitsensis TaxID=188872 RepID=A0A1X7IWH3_9FLAO|nr:VapE domain-containing protein [Arenibacter troitsensis]SMG19557.1 Virulence-associated protein E [Arenibacter troitsensis]
MGSENRSDPLYHVHDPKKKTVYDYTMEYLEAKYHITYNEISHDFQISFKGSQEWQYLNLNSLIIELAKAGIDIPNGKLETLLRSEWIPKCNPIREYFEALPKWDGEDHILRLASHVPTYETEAFNYHFKKWLVRTIKCALETNYFNKQAFVLSHQGQNSGKSTWCRFLCPPDLAEYMAEDISNDKDARIQLCRNFLYNLDELAVLSKKDVNALKSFFSKTFINERLPYDRKNTILPRICSFVGSTNMSSFLNDETGSVRWLCFELKGKIDFRYSKQVDIHRVWSQAYHLAYCDPTFEPELSITDIQENEERNKKYTKLTTEEELVSKYFEKSNDIKDFVTASDVLVKLRHLNLRLNQINLGRALSGFNFQRVKHPKRQVYGYLAKPVFTDSPLEMEV